MAPRMDLFSMRGMTAFASGAVAAVIASRVLPPLFGKAMGTAKAAAGRDPFDALARDHRALLSLLREMEETRTDAVLRRTQLLLRVKRSLAAHALAEEDVIYPLLREQANAIDDTRHLYAEHSEMKIHIHALEQLPKDAPEWLDRARALRQLVETHARKEEEVEFPKLRALLDERAVTRLSGNVQREKAMIL